MKTAAVLFLGAVTAGALAAGCAGDGGGGALFREKCAYCHPDGGNRARGDKGLKRADLQRNNIRSAADVVSYLRRPGPDMPTFDEQSLPDREAVVLAEYILKTFR